ncbi:MAG: AMIN domain-containing protein [Proteobacteria bacterium]|nr:AMIN domain-containing protein [Pseudomonadota bacterium]
MMKHFGHKGLVLGAVFCALAWVGSAQAAGYEVRMPVEKTVRLSPPQETPAAEAAKPVSPVVDDKKIANEKNAVADKKAADEKKAVADKKAAPVPPKAETPKAEAPKAKTPPPAASKPEVVKDEAAKPEAPKAPPAAKPAPAPKPKPAPKIDPLALETPPAPAPHEPIVLPAGGNYAGDVEVEFQSDHVILRIATNGPVERVTFFGVKVPRKLALDLHGPWRKKGPPVVRFSTGPVKNVVAGDHPDFLRLAMEFREGAVEPDMQPTVEKSEKGVTVTIPLALHLRP